MFENFNYAIYVTFTLFMACILLFAAFIYKISGVIKFLFLHFYAEPSP